MEDENVSEKEVQDSTVLVTNQYNPPSPSVTMYFASFSALLGGISAGLVVGYTSPALSSMSEDYSDPRVTDNEVKTWIGSLGAAGALIGGLLAGPLCGKYGRKPSLILNNLTLLTGWSLIVFASNVATIIVGRIITGIGMGYMCGCVSLYVLEICPTSVRGFFGSGFQLAVTIGILLVNIGGIFMDWRCLAVFCTFPCALMPCLMLPLPETPIYLMSKYGPCNETYCSLRKMRKHKDVTIEYEKLMKQPKEDQPIILDCETLKKPTVYKPLYLSLGLFFFQQFSGVTAIMFYQVDIFKQAGASIDPNVCAVITSAVQVAATLFAALFVDKFGRKFLLYVSGGGHVLSLTTLGFYFYMKNPSLGWLALASLSVFIIAFSVGFGPIPWMMGTEMTPYVARGFIGALSIGFNWTMAFIISNRFEMMQSLLTLSGTYWLFAFASFLSLVFTRLLLPETGGKSLEDIQKLF